MTDAWCWPIDWVNRIRKLFSTCYKKSLRSETLVRPSDWVIPGYSQKRFLNILTLFPLVHTEVTDSGERSLTSTLYICKILNHRWYKRRTPPTSSTPFTYFLFLFIISSTYLKEPLNRGLKSIKTPTRKNGRVDTLSDRRWIIQWLNEFEPVQDKTCEFWLS